MSSKWELDEGIKSIKSAWRREHTARANLEKMLEQAEAENAKLRELCVKALEWLRWAGGITCPPEVPEEFADELRELGVEVDE